jgi:hypothetical protein
MAVLNFLQVRKANCELGTLPKDMEISIGYWPEKLHLSFGNPKISMKKGVVTTHPCSAFIFATQLVI